MKSRREKAEDLPRFSSKFQQILDSLAKKPVIVPVPPNATQTNILESY